MTHSPPIAPLDASTRARLSCYVARVGEVGAVARLGIGRPQLARALGGLPIRRGTATIVRMVLDDLDASGEGGRAA